MDVRYRLSFALAAVLSAPAAGLAGPVWSVRSSFHSTDGPGVNYAYVVSGGTGAGGSYGLGVELYGVPGPGGGSPALQEGAETVQVGVFDPVTFNEAYQNPPTWTRTFDLDLEFTDRSTGRIGTLTYSGTFDSVSVPYWPPSPVDVNLDGPAARTLMVGLTRFDVSLRSFPGEYNGTGGVVWADVAVTAPLPEPGTLALAGIGLGLVGLRRGRRAGPPAGVSR